MDGTASNWALKEESVGHKHQQHQQDEDALYPNDTFVAYYEGEQQQVDGGIDEDLLAALSDGNSWGASDSKHGHSASNTKSASLMPTTDALDALLKEQQHRPPSTAAPVAAIGVSSAHAEKRFPSESNASKAPLSSGSASSSSYPRPSTIPPGPTSRTSYQRPSTMLSSGTSRTDGAAKTAVKPFAAAAASSTSSHGIHTTKPSPTEPNVTHSIRISYTRPSPTLPHNISSQKAPSPGISNRTYHSKPSPTLSGAPSPGLTSRSPQSHPSPKLGGPVTSTISPVIPPAKPSPSSPILSSQVPAPKNSNSTLQFSTVKPSPSFSFASGPPSASAFAPVSKDDPFAFAYSDSFLGTTKNEEESAAGLQNEYPVYSEVQEDIAYNYGSYSNPTEYSAQQQQQGQYSQEHGNPMVAFSTYGDGSHVSQEQPIEADTTETQQWSGQALALPNQETNFPQGWSRANTQQWDQQEQIATDPYSSNAEEGQPQDNGYSNEYGFGQESARVDSYYAEEHPTGYTEEPVFTQGSIQTTAYQTASPEYDQRSGLTSSYENQPRSGPVSSIIATPGYANTQSPFLPPSSRQAPARPSSGPSFADFSASSSASRDPLSMKQKGHAVATFGPAGSLVLVRPKRQDWFERDPLTGRSKPVQKVTPGQVLLGCTKDYLSPAVAQLYPPEWVGPFIDGKKTKTKKTAVQTCVQDRVTISQSQGSASQTLLWKLLKLMVDHDGVLLGSKNEILILPRLIELIKSDSSDSKSGSTSTLESLQTLLLEGKRSEACDLALSQSRYAHALIIASHVDKATYGRAITGFTNQEFLGPVTMAFSRSNNSTDSQHEYLPLHVLYGLFGGKGHQAGELFYFFTL